MAELTHLDKQGNAQMVDVSDKDITERIAIASASVSMLPATLDMVISGNHKKGDVLTIAKIAGIQAAKQCSSLIPLCHPLALSSIDVNLSINETDSKIEIESRCKVCGKTGVEMEALTAASAAALTIYDMCKAVDRGMVIGEIQLQHKSGGKSGSYDKPDRHTAA